MKLILVTVWTLLLFSALRTAPAAQAASVIPVASVERQANGVLLHMRPGALRIQVCTDRILRVTYAPTDAIPATLQDFVVNRRWPAVPFTVTTTPADVSVVTGKVIVRVARATGRVAFLSAQGQPILQEPAGGGKTMTPTSVNGEQSDRPEQAFVSPPDEVLYGLGQGQEGVWNWRGMPRRLEQHNTDIALPVLISSRGYGLFWNNASITDFNPADDHVAIDPATRQGAYTTKRAGEYVFMVRDGDRRGEIGVNVAGQDLAHIRNMWTPYAVAGRISLAANRTYPVTLLGGGRNAKVFARPLGDTTTFRSEAGDAIDYYFFYGPELDDVVAAFRTATGPAPLFPEWAYGFWQCREHYGTQQEVLAAAAEYRRRQIPVDLIVQDWLYWKSGWGAYDFDPNRYPDPAAMIQTLHDEHVKFMISAWSNPSGETHDALKAINGLVGEWVDVFNPAARQVRWDGMNTAFFRIGTDAWWQDATEPGDAGRALLGKQTHLGSGDRLSNAYPFFASEGTYEGQRATNPAKRVCNLTRSGYPGQQRFGAAVWSGDIHGDWVTFRRQIAGGLNLSITGMPYWTTDTAGFFHPNGQYTSEDYNELLVRWFQFSTFSPILRVHGWQTNTELWRWLPRTQEQLVAYDKLRYRLLPYAYSVAWRVTHDGDTILRPLVMDFRADPEARMISDEFLYGPAFLVAPVTEPKATTRAVYLPRGADWVDFWTGRRFRGGQTVTAAAPLEQVPLFVRAGSVVPFGPDVQYAGQKPADPIELRVYPGANGRFTLYEDEGDGYDYEKGLYATVPMTWDEKTQALTVGERRGRFPGMSARRTFRAVFVSPGHGVGLAPAAHPDQEKPYAGRAVTLRAQKKQPAR